MEPTFLRVLLVEDDDDHAALVEAYVEGADAPAIALTRAATVAAAEAALDAAHAAGEPFDVVLSDQRLPDSDYRETVGRVVRAARRAPVVALTSLGDPDIAAGAMRQGAQDYLVKAEITAEVLQRTLRYAAERARGTDALHAANEALRQTLAHARQMQEQIVEQETLAGLGGLLAGIAHELRNPLHLTVGFAEAAAGCADILAERLDIDGESASDLAELRAHLAKVVEHGHRADAVLRAMFEHARGVAGARAPVDLHGALDVAVSQATPAGTAPRVSRDDDAALAGVAVLAAGGALARAFYNVLENAALATPDGGQIRVATRLDASGAAPLALVEIADDGPGMTDEVAARIFEPFYTAWGPGQRIGLGLTLARSILASHGGRIAVDSQPGRGTRVRIALPVDAPAG